MKHTPGPWRIDKMNAEGIEVVGANGDLVHMADFGDMPSEFDSGRVENIINTEIANALLIAATFELHETLIKIKELNSGWKWIADDEDQKRKCDIDDLIYTMLNKLIL